MPRSSSRGRSAPSPPPRSANTATRPMPAQQPAQTQPQTQSSGGMFSGFGSTIMQGMAFGAGSEVAHQAVRSVMGGSSHSQQQAPQQQAPQQQAPQQTQQNPCQLEMQNFSNCLSTNDNINYCQNFSDMLKSCKQSYNLLWSIIPNDVK